MKSLDEKRDELAQKHFNKILQEDIEDCTEDFSFRMGWDACAKEYEKLNRDAVRLWNEKELLKKQLEIAKEALNKIKSPRFGLCMNSSDEEARQYWFDLASDYREQATQALKDLESAGE